MQESQASTLFFLRHKAVAPIRTPYRYPMSLRGWFTGISLIEAALLALLVAVASVLILFFVGVVELTNNRLFALALISSGGTAIGAWVIYFEQKAKQRKQT